jgi:hypothetical protein
MKALKIFWHKLIGHKMTYTTNIIIRGDLGKEKAYATYHLDCSCGWHHEYF